MINLNTSNSFYGRKVVYPNWERVSSASLNDQARPTQGLSKVQGQSLTDRVELSRAYLKMRRTNSVTYDFGDFS